MSFCLKIPFSSSLPLLPLPIIISCIHFSSSLNSVSDTQQRNWADEENDADKYAPSITIEEDGTKVTIEYKLNDQGKRVKVTRRTRTRIVKSTANHSVAERKVNLIVMF